MIDVRELLRRWAAGQSDRRIARETSTNRKTVGRYTAAARRLELPGDRELTDEEVHRVAQQIQTRPVLETSEQRQQVAEHRNRIEGWLQQERPLRLRKIHVLLKRDYGVQASYDTLRRFAIEELGWRKRATTVRLDDPPPGQEAQVDFGLMGLMPDPLTGRKRRLWVLIITLSHSRHQFVWPTFLQTTCAVCEGLDAAWRFFGGMPRTIVPDNMTAMISQADPLSPRLVDAFLDYVQARGIFVDPARVRCPRDKGRVENQVAYVRESWFDGESFTSLEQARHSAAHWCAEVAGRRVHGTTTQVPCEVFASVEKAALLAPPSSSYDVPIWADAKVHADHHVQVARALYSAPTRYVGKTVRIRADKTTVKIYCGTELIKVHSRVAAGKRSTDASDYPEGKATYAMRSIDGLIARARQRGELIGTYVERILKGPLPWSRMRQAYSLLSLCDRYGEGRVAAVCQSALAFDVIDVYRIRRMLQLAIVPESPTQASDAKVVPLPLPLPRFARSQSHFQTRSAATDKEGV